jgi:hypothetical protein
VDGIPVHQFFSLTSPRFLVGVHTHLSVSLTLEEALCIFGAVEAGLLRGGGIDFITERM